MSLELFFAILIKLWIFAADVAIETNIKAVPGAWSLVSESEQNCLMYRAPLQKDQLGQLAIFSRAIGKDCLESVAARPQAQLEIQELPKLSLEKTRLSVTLKGEEGTQEVQIPLWGKGHHSDRFAYISKIPLPSAQFLNPESECENNCHLCPRGFITLVTTEGLKKICHDPFECGHKDQPACYLGIDWVKKDENCFDGSKAGWCQPGLKTTCSRETDFLVCE